MYSEKVMDHFVNPRNVGEIDDASGVGQVGNAKCGDIMKIFIKVDENDVITDVKFKTFGCGAAIASSSMATELVKGKTVDEALQITNKMVIEALGGLPPVKLHCTPLLPITGRSIPKQSRLSININRKEQAAWWFLREQPCSLLF